MASGFTNAFAQFFARDKTFRPKKHFPPGTLKFQLHKQANASLHGGIDLREAVKCPPGEDLNDWLAVHIIDFFNRINLLYGVVHEFCTEQSCPVMSGGSKYQYNWSDGIEYKKPTSLPAPKYIELLMEWVETKINDENVFPVQPEHPFPKNYRSQCKKILTRLYRVFVHVYIHHFETVSSLGAEPYVNTCYKHFYLFVTEFSLVKAQELEPLKEMTEKLVGPMPKR